MHQYLRSDIDVVAIPHDELRRRTDQWDLVEELECNHYDQVDRYEFPVLVARLGVLKETVPEHRQGQDQADDILIVAKVQEHHHEAEVFNLRNETCLHQVQDRYLIYATFVEQDAFRVVKRVEGQSVVATLKQEVTEHNACLLEEWCFFVFYLTQGLDGFLQLCIEVEHLIRLLGSLEALRVALTDVVRR